jgi:hypothetical protein
VPEIVVFRHGNSHNYTLTVFVRRGTSPVARVEFYVGAMRVATVTSSTDGFSASVAVKQTGLIPIRAVAYDTVGRTSVLLGEIRR